MFAFWFGISNGMMQCKVMRQTSEGKTVGADLPSRTWRVRTCYVIRYALYVISPHYILFWQIQISMNQESKGFSEEDQRSYDQPRQVASNSQSPQKTKKIGRNGGRPSKKQKRQKPDPPEGQGSSNDQRETDPCEDNTQTLQIRIMGVLIDFFDQTLQTKGFVYSSDARKRYSKTVTDPRLKWNSDIIWRKDVQFQKARNICGRLQGLTEAQLQALVHVMVESSVIFAEEFTTEYYEILLKVYLLTRRLTRGEQKEYLDEVQIMELSDLLADDIFTNKDNLYYYFSYTFRNFRLDNDTFRKPTTNRPYRTLIKSLRTQLLQLP